CNGGKKEVKKESPSKQSNPVKESELNQITLTDKAVERLGIQTAEVVSTSVTNSRMFSGEIVAVPGKTITVTAPVAGTLLPSGKSISAGQQVSKGQSIYRLLILPSEKDLISAQEEVAQREVQYNTVLEKVKRTTRMYEEKSGSLRAKQEAEAELAGVTAQLRVAKGRVELLRGNPSAATSRLSTLNMEAPISGTVINVFSSPQQVLSAGAPILDIVSLNPVWVKVPLYAGDEGRIQKGGNATVKGLSEGHDNAVMARSVTGPQTSNALATSIDLYYEMDNSKGNFRPGQKVSVTLPFSGSVSGIVVPYSAIVYDIHGGTWVYTNPSPNVFVRQRVELKTVTGETAVLNRGPATGTKVVTVGAAELFGTEFGGGK
ncbi:MAG: efflux RND transporter periplasmic adaptor subunit, partial [Chitinophagaceae bacterium]